VKQKGFLVGWILNFAEPKFVIISQNDKISQNVYGSWRNLWNYDGSSCRKISYFAVALPFPPKLRIKLTKVSFSIHSSVESCTFLEPSSSYGSTSPICTSTLARTCSEVFLFLAPRTLQSTPILQITVLYRKNIWYRYMITALLVFWVPTYSENKFLKYLIRFNFVKVTKSINYCRMRTVAASKNLVSCVR
jgi:hypothetical protein